MNTNTAGIADPIWDSRNSDEWNQSDYTPISDPTSRSDAINDELRTWYEANRETWWQRHAPYQFGGSRLIGCADSFMFRLVAEVERLQNKYSPRK